SGRPGVRDDSLWPREGGKVNSGRTFSTQAAGNTASRSSFLLMLWPWGLVIIAWGILLLASSSSHLSALDHDYLLRESHLPWTLALVILLGSWYSSHPGEGQTCR